MNRRQFAAITSGLIVTFTTGCALPVIPKRPKPEYADGLSWIRFAEGRYTLFIPRVEMGQNILTALKQIACEELTIEWHLLNVKIASTADIVRVRATVGSESIKDFALPLAQACATLREAILMGLTQKRLEAKALPVSELRSFKANGKFVGRTVVIEQGNAIVTGQPLYVGDVRRKGMVYGRVLRANASPELESTLVSFNEAAAKAVPGFVSIVRSRLLLLANSEGIGIVASTPGALDRIELALVPVWKTVGAFNQIEIDRSIDIDRRFDLSPSLMKKVHSDSVDKNSQWDVDLRFDIPLAAHAPIQPRASVAEFSNDGVLQIWVGTQDVFYQRDVISKRMGIDEASIIVHGTRVGGAFGGKTICTVELEAAVLAKEAQMPVKVQWTRAQEFQFGFHRPPSSHRVRVSLSEGRLNTWWHGFSSSHILFTNAIVPAWLQKITNLVGDDGVARGASLLYNAKVRRTEFDLVRIPIFTGPWRGLGAGANGLVIESAIDECALFAKTDPIEFRLQHLDDPRLIRVLKRVAVTSQWGFKAAAEALPNATIIRGRGVACGVYKGMSYVAVVADVEMLKESGAIRVTKIWCVHDCGIVINPDQVKAQCEGNLVWGISMVFSDLLPVGKSKVAASTFGDSPIPLFAEIPPMEIDLIDAGEPPSGAGETAIVAAGAAIANAIRAATGIRVQRFPIKASSFGRQVA
jgi:isoquinoline 1-oxidoreductase subunit beta